MFKYTVFAGVTLVTIGIREFCYNYEVFQSYPITIM